MTHTLRTLAAILVATLAILPAFGQPDREPDDALSVMTFNIRFGTANDGPNAWPNRAAEVIAVLQGTGTPKSPEHHIVGLQEALEFQIDAILEALPGYTSIGVGRDDGKKAGEYCAILYRPDRVKPIKSGTRWLSDAPTVPGSMDWGNRITRIFTWAEFQDRAAPKPSPAFLFVNTHWDHQSAPSREQSAAAIAAWLNEGERVWMPRVVVGDFNAGETTPERRFLADDAKLRDTWRDAFPDTPEPETFCGFRTEDREGRKIDAVLVSEHWKTKTAAIDRRGTPEGRSPSDHFPISAVITRDKP
jgi:endonuclease/exonuclease/phosphatase family metal-dependent hydrolase